MVRPAPSHFRTAFLASPCLGDTRPVKVYFAGPLFTTPERTWNAEVASALRAAGHEVFLPQEKEPGKDGRGIFAADVAAIDWADGLVAIMDGPDPDSGTAWEVGYAFGTRKPVVLVRTDVSLTRRQRRRLQRDAHGGRHGPDRAPRRLDHGSDRGGPRRAIPDRRRRTLTQTRRAELAKGAARRGASRWRPSSGSRPASCDSPRGAARRRSSRPSVGSAGSSCAASSCRASSRAAMRAAIVTSWPWSLGT